MRNDQMEELYIKYHREVYLYALSLCGNYHLAQDLASDAFFKAYLSISDLSYIKYWLFRVCKNLYFDFIKQNREYSSDNIFENTLTNKETPLDKVIESEEKKHLYGLVTSLHESYREILILYYFCDFSLNEISKIRNTSVGAAKTMLFRARRKLKKELEGEK